MLADGEKFLWAAASRAAYVADGIALWRVPPSSPDFNPVGKMWGWLRKRLRPMGLMDLKSKGQAPGKAAYKRRIRNLVNTKSAQGAAAKFVLRLKSVSKVVVKGNGARTRR